ncbi:MAG: hypothetical protein LBR23_07050 [Spirochaetaceae bacterium]|jgi:hypothetical protein|nr:hypothetical protein [Spirochaetaceae bacterium]
MNQDSVKAMLLDLENTSLDFSVIFTGKASKRVNGLYKPDTLEILLHNKNFSSDGQLVYTAIHEYAHHLEHEKLAERMGGLENAKALSPLRFHTTDFWARFHRLLEAAEEKGYYKLDPRVSEELGALTEQIRKQVEQNGVFMRELGDLLIKAQELCRQEKIRYEDYVDRVLLLPRNAARAITRASLFQVNPAIGGENMKYVASLGPEEKRKAAEAQFLAGKSPDTVRSQAGKPAGELDRKTQWEREKNRLEKTIEALTKRLHIVEENLANL